MKTKRLITFSLLVLILTGCNGLGNELVQIVVALGNAPIVTKRIAGSHYITFSKGDPSDTYSSQDGFLCVTHNPGCGSWIFSSGNSGTDKFFDAAHSLPAGCQIVSVIFTAYWPDGICASGNGGIGGYGSYGSQQYGGATYLPYVHWNNSCQSDFAGKPLYYRISFIVSMIKGTDMGEAVFDDLAPTATTCQPQGYSSVHPTYCATPPAQCSQYLTSDRTLNLVLPANHSSIYYTLNVSLNNGCSGAIYGLHNPNLYPVTLVSGAKTLTLGVNAAATTQEMTTFFGSANPALPVTLNINPNILPNQSGGTPIPAVGLDVDEGYYQ